MLIDPVIIDENKETAVNAIKKVSVSVPDPNFAAINDSLIKPKNLLAIVKIIILYRKRILWFLLSANVHDYP